MYHMCFFFSNQYLFPNLSLFPSAGFLNVPVDMSNTESGLTIVLEHSCFSR